MQITYDGDGDDDKGSDGQGHGDDGGAKTGDYNLGDEIGERVGEGHDAVEDEVT